MLQQQLLSRYVKRGLRPRLLLLLLLSAPNGVGCVALLCMIENKLCETLLLLQPPRLVCHVVLAVMCEGLVKNKPCHV